MMEEDVRKRLSTVILWPACLAVMASSAFAGTIIYANSAGTPHIDVIDATNMNVTSEFTVNGGSGNGRGVVVVGNTLYYTLANSGSVYSYDLTTHADTVAFTVAGASGLSTIAFDGTNFWIGDYSGTNQAYNYSPNGTLLSTVALSDCTGYCDGLEFFLQGGQGRLISNRGDSQSPGIYDVYSTTGVLLQPSFITTTFGATGIAYDGTNFRISDRSDLQIATYNGTTGAFISDQPITGYTMGPNVEDLSVNYNLVLPPPPGTPEPASLALVSGGLGSLLYIIRRRKRTIV